jgi:hypothetical protein
MRRAGHVLRLLGAASLAALAVAPPALAAPDVPTVPGDVAVDEGHKPFLVGHAVGVQIYTCTVVASGFAWGPASPRADLDDNHGRRIVRHFAGPVVAGQRREHGRRPSRRGVSVDFTAIPWLLLETVSTTPGADGDRLAGGGSGEQRRRSNAARRAAISSARRSTPSSSRRSARWARMKRSAAAAVSMATKPMPTSMTTMVMMRPGGAQSSASLAVAAGAERALDTRRAWRERWRASSSPHPREERP